MSFRLFRPGSRRAFFRQIFFLILFSAVLTVRFLPGGPEAFRKAVFAVLPVPAPWEMELTGSPFERGRIHGRKMSWAIRLLDKVYIRHFAPNEKLDLHLKRAEKIFSELDREWQDEITGMAETSGTDRSILMLGNSFLDMGLNASGCRQIHVRTAEGAVLHSHNLDWDNLGGVGNYLVVIGRSNTPGKYRTVHIGFPGMIGVLDVINEHGIALSFNQLGLAPKGSAGKPVFIAMREIAEQARTFEEAAEMVNNIPPGMQFIIGLSDAKTGKIAVFERDGYGADILRRDAVEGIATADNSAFGHRKTDPNSIDGIVRQSKPKGPDGLIALLRHPRILLGCNIYSIVFDWKNNRFFLASGTVPAALGKYREFILFDGKTEERQ